MSSKGDKTGSGRVGKKSYRHVETLSLSSIKTIYEFDELENGLTDAILIRTDNHTSDGRIFKEYPFVIPSNRDAFMNELRKQYYRQRASGEIVVSTRRRLSRGKV